MSETYSEQASEYNSESLHFRIIFDHPNISKKESGETINVLDQAGFIV